MSLTVECKVHFDRRGAGSRKKVLPGPDPLADIPAGRTPRVSKLMALAIRLESLVRSGTVDNYSRLAELAQVTRARISQILNLLQLAPDIQEEVLFLPRIQAGRERLQLHQLQPIAHTLDWSEQKVLWKSLKQRVGM